MLTLRRERQTVFINSDLFITVDVFIFQKFKYPISSTVDEFKTAYETVEVSGFETICTIQFLKPLT